MKYEKTFILLDLGIFFLLFFAGIAFGIYVPKSNSDVWFVVNETVICVVLIGELAWWKIKRVAAEWSLKCSGKKKTNEDFGKGSPN